MRICLYSSNSLKTTRTTGWITGKFSSLLIQRTKPRATEDITFVWLQVPHGRRSGEIWHVECLCPGHDGLHAEGLLLPEAQLDIKVSEVVHQPFFLDLLTMVMVRNSRSFSKISGFCTLQHASLPSRYSLSTLLSWQLRWQPSNLQSQLGWGSKGIVFSI